MSIITRSHVAGAIKVLNAVGSKDRRGALRKMLLVEYSEKETTRALTTLDDYPEWRAGVSLDEVGAADVNDVLDAAPRRKPKKGGDGR